MTDEQLSALLRLKRYETPPPGYFEGLLANVHRRQRAELLQRPLWKIALERLQTFFSEHSMGPLSYAGAVASVLVAGVLTLGVFRSGPGKDGSGAVAALQREPAGSTLVLARATPEPLQSLDYRLANASSAPVRRAPLALPQRAPRYIIDARPVSYEPSFSF